MKSFLKYVLVPLMYLPLSLNAQDYYPGQVWITVNNPSIIPSSGYESSNSAFSQVLSEFEITEINQPMAFAKTESLRRVFELITFRNEDSLVTALEAINSENVLFSLIEKVPIPIPLYNPSDYMWQLMLDGDSTNDWLWYLKIIEADKAWNITKGDSSIQIYHYERMDLTHPDLKNKFNPNYDFWNGDTTRQPLGSWVGHGTAVATLMGGETSDSGTVADGQIASVGYKTGIMYSKWQGGAVMLAASTVHKAEIFNLSWYIPGGSYTGTWRAIEDEVLSNGTIVVRGAGNGWDMNDSAFAHVPIYPFSGLENPEIIVVSSTDENDLFDPANLSWNYHSHYPQVDLCAPGHDIMAGTQTLDANNNVSSWPYFGGWRGTSFASPITAGTVALMKAVNPCLNSNWAQDLLKNTTDPIADASSFPGVIGTGRLNAHRAVQAAQAAYRSDLDLYIKDRPEDFGYPGSYAWGWWFDKSPDIWVRNQADGFSDFRHQEPEYSANSPVYVYVRVWNKSCDSSNGEGNLSLYWSKASSASSWPQNWDGTQPTIGDQIGSVSIPNLGPGESKIFEFEWDIINPYIHSNWASCLLARIEGIQADAITIYPNDLGQDVFQNNNIALHNVTVVDINPGKTLPEINGIEYPHGRFMYVGNATNHQASFDITLEVAYDESTASIVEEAEVHIFTDEAGWQIIGTAVENHPDLQVVGDKEFIVLNDNVTLQNISFESNERIPLYVGFSFLIDEITMEETYHYRVAQRFAGQENDITGAEHFIIHKSPRDAFSANAGFDQQIRRNDSTNVNADDILEPAIYNWYDPEGNLIYSGKNATVSPDITTTYRLEVVAGTDGFKDYDDVVIEVQQYWLEDIAPNPTASITNISYQIEGASSAYLMILNGFGTVSNNYILTPNGNQVNLDVSSYTPGVYNVILIVDGQAVDAKALVVQ